MVMNLENFTIKLLFFFCAIRWASNIFYFVVEKKAFKDRLCLRKSSLEGGGGDGLVLFSWDGAYGGGSWIKKTPVWLWKLFLDTSCVCLHIIACVSVPCFLGGSGHTCTPLSLCFGCQGLDTLSLFFLYLWELELYPHPTQKLKQTAVYAELTAALGVIY